MEASGPDFVLSHAAKKQAAFPSAQPDVVVALSFGYG